MLIDVIKADITTATRMRNQLASDILKVVLGEFLKRSRLLKATSTQLGFWSSM